jgi:catechol 2,3-dioxygenase-like lactoylglutathione lyase family enzyme
MRLDHIAYRVADRNVAAKFFIECFGYRIPDDLPDGFDITFEDGTKALCYVLVPPEKIKDEVPWSYAVPPLGEVGNTMEYHLAPEIFISDGTEGSIVREWVKARGGTGGIHHLAYQVESVENKMEEWKQKGFAEFTTPDPLRCEGLTQVFTKPSQLTGIIYEFIEREQHGFCRDNVRELMKSTKEFAK